MAFISPKQNGIVISLTRWIVPWVLRRRHVVKVECPEADLDRLRSLRDERVMLIPNHPTATEPIVMYYLTRLVKQRFHFVCAREVFDMAHGLWGWVIRRLGAYSIVRGTSDRRSFKMTRQILAQPGAKLVMFPEGEVYSQNDSLLPFHGGVVQLGFWGLEDLLKAETQEPLYILPIAMKYKYVEDMRPAIVAALDRLEAALDLPGGADEPYGRIRRIGETVIGKLEADYGVCADGTPAEPEDEQDGLQTRMLALKQAIVQRVAEGLRIPAPSGPVPSQMRYLINALHEVTDDEQPLECSYDARLWADHRSRAEPLLRDLDRLSNWVAVFDGYVAAHPTPERMGDLIQRLEIEVLGEIRCVGKQHCLVRMGEPVNIADHYDRYKADRRETVEWLTEEFELAVQSMLDEMSREAGDGG